MKKTLAIILLSILYPACSVRRLLTLDSTSSSGPAAITCELQSQRVSVEAPADCKRFEFRYLVVANDLYSANLRHVDVFIDDSAFAEDNLKELFIYLSNKFPDPADLTVEVNTSWRQLPLPSDCPATAMSSQAARWKNFDYHGAIFYRRGERSYFRFNPDLKVKEEKTVVLETPN